MRAQRNVAAFAAVAARRATLAQLTTRHAAIDPAAWPVPRQVDYRLIGSALARVRWELDGAPAWRRDPAFYIQQALGPVFDVLLPVPPVSAARADLVIARLGNAARIVVQAKANLDDARAPFARLAIDTLSDIDTRLARRGARPRPDHEHQQNEAMGDTDHASSRYPCCRAITRSPDPHLPIR